LVPTAQDLPTRHLWCGCAIAALEQYLQNDLPSRDDTCSRIAQILGLPGDRRSFLNGLDNPLTGFIQSSRCIAGMEDPTLNEAANASIRLLLGADEKPA